MRLDQDVVDWFKAQGSDDQTRINAVLPADKAVRMKHCRSSVG